MQSANMKITKGTFPCPGRVVKDSTELMKYLV